MNRVARQDRKPIEPAIFRQAMTDVFGPRPDFRRAARELGVPKSTLHRLWNGGRNLSADKSVRACPPVFGVDWPPGFGPHCDSPLSARSRRAVSGGRFSRARVT